MIFEENLNLLERRTRRLQFMVALLTITLSVMIVIIGLDHGKGWPLRRIVRTRRIQVVNESNVPVVVLQNMNEAGVIRTVSAQGRATLFYVGQDDGGNGFMSTYSTDGMPLVGLGATGRGDGIMQTYNKQGQKLVAIGATEKSSGAVITFDGFGSVSAEWP